VPLHRLDPALASGRMVLIRKAEARDRDLIEGMLLAAADWRPGTESRPIAAVMADSALAHYAEGWPKPTDVGLVAEDEGGLGVGAAWWRYFLREDPGYGFVDEAIPEVSIGVVTECRGAGIGRALLDALVACAVSHNLRGLSLSVETDNFALGLYERSGFERQGEAGGSITMLLALDGV
jgi:GNAT superfamily N-acetyltransferase